jgi:hypothetical protein
MKTLILTLAAALTLGGLAAAPAAAQPGRERTVVTRTVIVRHHDNGWHRGWNRGWHRGRHLGWNRHGRSCRTVWHHHMRTRTCSRW